jgi:hypothetical protein
LVRRIASRMTKSERRFDAGHVCLLLWMCRSIRVWSFGATASRLRVLKTCIYAA